MDSRVAKERSPTFLRWFLGYYCFSPTMQGAIRNRGIPTGRMELPMYQAWPSPGHSWKGTKHTHTHNLITGQFGTGPLEPSMQQRSPFNKWSMHALACPNLMHVYTMHVYTMHVYTCVCMILCANKSLQHIFGNWNKMNKPGSQILASHTQCDYVTSLFKSGLCCSIHSTRSAILQLLKVSSRLLVLNLPRNT